MLVPSWEQKHSVAGQPLWPGFMEGWLRKRWQSYMYQAMTAFEMKQLVNADNDHIWWLSI